MSVNREEIMILINAYMTAAFAKRQAKVRLDEIRKGLNEA